LFTDKKESVIAARGLVKEGAQLWVDGEYRQSVAAYEQASKLALQTDSLFDSLWVDLNKADTELRLGKFDEVREILSHTSAIAAREKFLWLHARTLSLYGATLRLTTSYTEMLDLLSTADQEFVHLDAPHDRVRGLYYLAYYRHSGGDQDQALKLGLQGLCIADETDTVRISTLDWLLGAILFRHGMRDKSLLFARESVDQSLSGPYARGVLLQSSITLAELYQSLSEYKLADESLQTADESFQKVPEGYDQIRYELILGIFKAKAKINDQKYVEAEKLLQRNLEIYSQQPFSATPLLSQSLMLLAQVYANTGRSAEAGRKFNEAIDIVEKDDEYMKAEGLRVKFDDQRRELYDSAIEFEFQKGSSESAWRYLQRYRAKIFLEFLAVFNPDIEPMRTNLNPAAVRGRIPSDTQVVEYALLEDRLLIWVVTDKLFTVRSVSISRNDLESKVQTALRTLRAEDNVDAVLTDLGRLLITPVADLLDLNRTLVIIPDRALHGLPFEALKQPGKAQYLIQEFSIMVSPSLTHLLAGDAAPPARNAIVGFGSQNGGANESKELSALENIYSNATTLVGRQVDKGRFLDELTKAAVFHYAGHSATDAADPLRSSILLDGNRSGSNSVTAVDISQRRLMRNAVVILSSCDSSVGNSRDGIGVRGLTSAFLIGGAGSVVGSLWPVEASSTADLMIRFHRAFAKSGMPVAKALRQAQLNFLQTHPDRAHPYYWSGFVVTGNFSALR
jgi:CHAT domain-containing protein